MATIKIGGKDVPLTKNGLPNRVYLSKEARDVVKKYEVEMKEKKKKIVIKELEDALKGLQ